MASPFDISTYETALSSKDAVNPEVLARANRAARVAKFGEAAVARMEAAGNVFRGVGATPSVTPAPAVATEAAPLTRFARLRNLLNPAITGRGLARVARGVGKFGAIGGVAGGAVQSIVDTPEDVAALGESVGLDASTTPGRIGANVVNVARNIGDYASFGIAPRVGRMLTGGSFFDPASGRMVKSVDTTAPAPIVPPLTTQAPVSAVPDVTPSVRRVATPNRAASAALDGPYTGDLPVGTGFIRNEATGETREFRGGGATPTAPWAGITRGGRVAIDASGMRTRRDAAAATAALAARGAFLRGEAAFMKAEEGNDKPESTTVIPSMVPGGKSEVIQVKRGVAKQLAVRKELPAGYDATSAMAEAQATLKAQGNTKKVRDALNARLAEYGLPALQ